MVFGGKVFIWFDIVRLFYGMEKEKVVGVE